MLCSDPLDWKALPCWRSAAILLAARLTVFKDSSCFGEYEGEVETAGDSVTVTVYALELGNPRGSDCNSGPTPVHL